MRVKTLLVASTCLGMSGAALAQTAHLPSDNSPKSATQAGPTDANAVPVGPAASTVQTAPPTNAPAVGDIIVTAQRRDQSLSKTPVSIAVVSADTLAKANIVSENDLRVATPGLQVRSGQNSNQINFSLRGQSQDPYSNTRPGVLPYFNDVQISGSAGASTFYDLQSVQVLKGPQGTLFGRSATGGAILYNTAKPTADFGGYVSGLYGNYDQHKIEGAINIPLSTDQLLFRLAGFWRGREGYQYNIYDNTRAGKQKQFGVRPSLTFKVGPSFRNDLVVDYYKSDSQNTVGVISGLLPFTGGNSAPYVPSSFLYAGNQTAAAFATGTCTIQAFAGVAAPCPPTVIPGLGNFYNNYFSDPRRPSSLAQALADQQARGPFKIDSDGQNIAKTRNTVLTNTSALDVADNLTVKNIFGYASIQGFNSADADGTAFAIAESNPKGFPVAGIRTKIDQFSDELQLVGKAFNNNLEYVVGGFASHELNILTQHSALFDIVFGGIQETFHVKTVNDTLAGYAQGTYHFGDSGFSVTAGGRYTSEKVSKKLLPGDIFRTQLGDPAPAGYDYDQSKTFNKFSYTVGAQYQATSALLFYVTSRRAYKSGGFNGETAPFVGNAAVGGDGYAAERVTDAEAGAKFNGHLGSMPFRFNGDFYYDWVKNRQSSGFGLLNGSAVALTVNVPKARVYGVEIDGQIKPVRYLTVGGNFNYTNAQFTDGNAFLLGNSVLYDQVPDTPKYSGAAFAEIDVPVRGDISAVLHGEAYHQSTSTISPRSVNYAGTDIHSYTLADFRVGLEDDHAGWSLTANLKNAFNKVYYAGGLQTGEIYQINTLIPGEPRTYTLELRYKF